MTEPITVPAAKTYVRAAGLGIVAGMRSMMPFALLALAARRGTFARDAGRPLSILRGRAVLPVAAFAAAGELVADKLPMTPSRIDPGPLSGRIVLGALAGAAICREARRSAIAGALLGGAGAAGGSFGGYHARKALGRATRLPDPLWAVAEDALAVSLGLLTLRPYSR